MRQMIYNSHKKGLDFDKSLQPSGASVVWHQRVYYHLFWELSALWPKQNLTLQSSSFWNLHFAFRYLIQNIYYYERVRSYIYENSDLFIATP